MSVVGCGLWFVGGGKRMYGVRCTVWTRTLLDSTEHRARSTFPPRNRSVFLDVPLSRTEVFEPHDGDEFQIYVIK